MTDNLICCLEINASNTTVIGNRHISHLKYMTFIQMIIIQFIPILALLIQTWFSLYHIIQYRHEVVIATDLGRVASHLQLERWEVLFYIYTNGSVLKSNLTQRYTTTDEAIHNMTTWTQIILPTSSNDQVGEVMLDKTTFQMRLNSFRTQILSGDKNKHTVFKAMLWYMTVSNAMLDHLTYQIKDSDKSGIWRYLIDYKNLFRRIENIGIAAVYGINYFGRGHLSTNAYVNYIKYDTLGRDLLNTSFTFVQSLEKDYINVTNFPEYESIKNRSKIISSNRKINPSIGDAIKYYETMTFYIERLQNILSNLRKRIKEKVCSLLKEARDKEAIGFAILVSVPTIIIIFLRNTIASIQINSVNLVQKARELKLEQKKSDTLLFQMLPRSVAIRLKETRTVPAEFFESATIYFSDIVGFTEIASTCSPLEVCSFLNSIYKLFDERIECYDVYKVETCGDAYMVASGLPERSYSKKHVSEIATMALDFLDASRYFEIPHSHNEKLQIRIGIHTGSVGAGIIGTKMPRYCLFGDTVNVASRMESTGEASKIHITSEVNDELQVIGGFTTEARGLINVKGKGLMETYWLIRKKENLIIEDVT
ncbi:CLUMA_CG003008, isoform A [Clunio marinus]|uniref:CLUMA_CG003008, isoform A n=1 Tax=Clunio marinus TaxID=568069 RepID=A0A1J1HSS3_9DIPT|nr:CLUMA_CG003008, isoform A [Clunio marinus]